MKLTKSEKAIFILLLFLAITGISLLVVGLITDSDVLLVFGSISIALGLLVNFIFSIIVENRFHIEVLEDTKNGEMDLKL